MSKPTWKQSLKSSALDALADLAQDLAADAKKLLADLEKSDHTVKLGAEPDSIEVYPPVGPELGNRIRALKPQLLDVLRNAPVSWGWTPDDVSVKVSLCQSAILDFVLAPPVDGVEHAKIAPRIQTVLLAGASPEWRARVKALGGLCAYSLSQWAKAELILKAKMAAKGAA